MHLRIRVDRTNLRRWLLELQCRLSYLGHTCAFEAVRPQIVLPSSVDWALRLERLLFRLDRAQHWDPVDWETLAPRRTDVPRPDVILDMSSGNVAHECDVPRLLVQCDGHPCELGLMNAVFSGRMPTIAVAEAATGAVLSSGKPFADNASSAGEAAGYAFEGAIGVVAMALSRLERPDKPLRLAAGGSARAQCGLIAVLNSMCSSIAFSSVSYLYKLCCYSPHWRVGWRFLDEGSRGVHETLSLAGKPWRVLPDPGVRFFADPFPIEVSGRYFIFFEDFDHLKAIGRISYVEVKPDGSISSVREALSEPWHLSYPFVFQEGAEIWMLPESSADRTLSLYKANPFPHRWTREATLFRHAELSDATLVRYDGKLWMFATERKGSGSYSDTLVLFTAPEVFGPWRAHPMNPVLIDQRAARPAGNCFLRDGRLWRPVQDCERGYGTGVGLAEVIRLEETAFEQSVRTVLRPCASWRGRRLHTMTRHGVLECVDGSAHSVKSRILAESLRDWITPNEPLPK